MKAAVGLPPLSPEEAEHSALVEARIREAIDAAGGWIGFGRYMQIALYEPGLGYYSAGARKLGEAGDFVTAPESAPLFSRCLALQCEEVLHALGGGDVLELGAGSGRMAADLLVELEHRGALPQRYRILDLSADLRDRQRAELESVAPRLLERVEWLERMPERHEGLILANEVLDAMPVERFVIRDGEVRALGVSWRGEAAHWAEGDAPPQLQAAVRDIEQELGASFEDGYVSEVNLGIPGWLAALGATLVRGVALLVDYGLPRREYYSPERRTGTLLCHSRHRWHDDPFARPGLQDITAWVDFTAVAEGATAAGLSLAGYTTQAHFLLGSGLGEFLAAATDMDTPSRLRLSRQAQLLTLPGEMGERFKAIALARDCDGPLRGFVVRDLRHAL